MFVWYVYIRWFSLF